MRIFNRKIHLVYTFLLITSLSCTEQKENHLGEIITITDYKHVGLDGPTLLMIPCMSCRWNEWESFMERNKDQFSMYAITVPGFGGTPTPDLPLNNTNKTPWRDNLIRALSYFIDQHDLSEVTIIGHSWGSQIALQVAASHRDVVVGLINLDGSIESKSWIPTEMQKKADILASIDSIYLSLVNSADEWKSFNGVSYRYQSQSDSIPVSDVEFALKLHGSFMSTPKEVLHQYWRENVFIDLDKYLHQLDTSIRILDIQSFKANDGNYTKYKNDYLKIMEEVNAPDHIEYVFMYETGHFIMQHRPEALDQIIKRFIAGEKIKPVYLF